VAKELVRRLKFERTQAGAKNMAQLIANNALFEDKPLITYAPTAQTRVRLRGYDQAALIAKMLALYAGGTYVPLLVRIGDVRQVGQGRAARQQQMKGVFRAINTRLIKNKHILLIDDVLTTGSTCEAAARVLKDAGAKRVSAAVFAVA
jgi:competence protein ComFC